MKAITYLIIGFVLGAAIGWFAGFLRLPYIEKLSFLIGFIASLVLVILLLALLYAWKKHTSILRLIREDITQQQSKSAIRTYSMIWIIIAGFILACGLASSFLIYRQSKIFKSQLQKQNEKILEQSELIESIRKSNAGYLMSNIMENVEEELKNNGRLSDTVIARIAALSFSLKPYRYLEGDSLIKKELSPERGQLLTALLLMKMDSGSFARIKQSTTFASADLKGANLKSADLSSANLSGANLKDGDLSDANLSNADLNDANLWGANLRSAILSGADLKRSDLRWAELNGTDLRLAIMNGAQMSSAQLINVDAEKASIQYADLGSAVLSEANMTGVSFLGTAMKKINLNKADFTRTDLRQTDLNEASLLGTELDRALVDSNWNDKINSWRLTGANQIQKSYSVISDTLDQWKNHIYRLKKIQN